MNFIKPNLAYLNVLVHYFDSIKSQDLSAILGSLISLYDHQIFILNRIMKSGLIRFILGDEVGLGKTIEASLVLKELIYKKLVNKIFISVPPNLKNQWQKELKRRFSEDFEVIDSMEEFIEKMRNPRRRAPNKVIISNKLFDNKENHEIFLKYDWDLVIIDEAHHIRYKTSGKTEFYKFFEKFKENAKYILFLTATPIQMEYFEFFSILKLLRPDIFTKFDLFKVEVESLNNIKKQYFDLREKIKKESDPNEKKVLENQVNSFINTHKITEVLIRNKKRDIFHGIPNRNTKSIIIELSDKCQKIFNKMWDILEFKIKKAGEDDFGTKIQAQQYQRYLLSSYAALDEFLFRKYEEVQFFTDSEIKELVDLERIEPKDDLKLKKLIELLKTLLKHNKIIIYIEWIPTLNYLSEQISKNFRDIIVSTFHGGLTPQEKEKTLKDFKDLGDVLITTRAGGEGMNLQFANIIINYDLPWNPMELEQRIGRIDRINQKRDIFIYNFILKNPLDLKIYQRLLQRIGFASNVMGRLDEILGYNSALDDFLFEEKEKNLENIEEDLILKERSFNPEEIRLKKEKISDKLKVNTFKNFLEVFNEEEGIFTIRKDGTSTKRFEIINKRYDEFSTVDRYLASKNRELDDQEEFKHEIFLSRSYTITFDRDYALKNLNDQFLGYFSLSHKILDWIIYYYKKKYTYNGVVYSNFNISSNFFPFEGDLLIYKLEFQAIYKKTFLIPIFLPHPNQNYDLKISEDIFSKIFLERLYYSEFIGCQDYDILPLEKKAEKVLIPIIQDYTNNLKEDIQIWENKNTSFIQKETMNLIEDHKDKLNKEKNEIRDIKKYGDKFQKRILPAKKGKVESLRRKLASLLEENAQSIIEITNKSKELNYKSDLILACRININREEEFPRVEISLKGNEKTYLIGSSIIFEFKYSSSREIHIIIEGIFPDKEITFHLPSENNIIEKKIELTYDETDLYDLKSINFYQIYKEFKILIKKFKIPEEVEIVSGLFVFKDEELLRQECSLTTQKDIKFIFKTTLNGINNVYVIVRKSQYNQPMIDFKEIRVQEKRNDNYNDYNGIFTPKESGIFNLKYGNAVSKEIIVYSKIMIICEKLEKNCNYVFMKNANEYKFDVKISGNIDFDSVKLILQNEFNDIISTKNLKDIGIESFIILEDLDQKVQNFQFILTDLESSFDNLKEGKYIITITAFPGRKIIELFKFYQLEFMPPLHYDIWLDYNNPSFLNDHYIELGEEAINLDLLSTTQDPSMLLIDPYENRYIISKEVQKYSDIDRYKINLLINLNNVQPGIPYDILLSPNRIKPNWSDWSNLSLGTINVIDCFGYKKNPEYLELLLFIPKNICYKLNGRILENIFLPFQFLQLEYHNQREDNLFIEVNDIKVALSIPSSESVKNNDFVSKCENIYYSALAEFNNNFTIIVCYPTKILFQSQISEIIEQIFFKREGKLQIDIIGYPYIGFYTKPFSNSHKLRDFVKEKFIPPISCICEKCTHPILYYENNTKSKGFSKCCKCFLTQEKNGIGFIPIYLNLSILCPNCKKLLIPCFKKGNYNKFYFICEDCGAVLNFINVSLDNCFMGNSRIMIVSSETLLSKRFFRLIQERVLVKLKCDLCKKELISSLNPIKKKKFDLILEYLNQNPQEQYKNLLKRYMDFQNRYKKSSETKSRKVKVIERQKQSILSKIKEFFKKMSIRRKNVKASEFKIKKRGNFHPFLKIFQDTKQEMKMLKQNVKTEIDKIINRLTDYLNINSENIFETQLDINDINLDNIDDIDLKAIDLDLISQETKANLIISQGEIKKLLRQLISQNLISNNYELTQKGRKFLSNKNLERCECGASLNWKFDRNFYIFFEDFDCINQQKNYLFPKSAEEIYDKFNNMYLHQDNFIIKNINEIMNNDYFNQ